MNIIKSGMMVAGILSLALAIFHIPGIWQYVFPDWKEELERTSLLNRKLVNTILIALALLLLIFALISLVYAEELSQGEGLAVGITVAYSLFWLWRTVWQVLYFYPSKIDHDVKLLLLHYFLIVIFSLLFVVYLLPVVLRLTG